MIRSAREEAEARQFLASDPETSAFVAASAGSGKTKLLTDRLLRLMLSGADPARIQCLTYTKAAAAEMANRLHRMLGEWVTMEDAALDAALHRLGVSPDAGIRAQARALFARVLDLPGGMRIGTIHAFCQSLLRRFPLEAQISPHFRLIEDRDADEALREAREAMLAAARGQSREAAVAAIAAIARLDDFARLVPALQSDRNRLGRALALGGDLAAAQRRVLGVTDTDPLQLLVAACAWRDEGALGAAARHVLAEGSPSYRKAAAAMLNWLNADAASRAQRWDEWHDLFIRSDGEPRAVFVNKDLLKRSPALAESFAAEAVRILAVEDAHAAASVAQISTALLDLAAPVLGEYATSKDEHGLVDYADLIDLASKLLVDPGAAWVLYKLDGGLDHLLLDEVQDTSPAQWAITRALTGEFFAGEGAARAGRTVFAVGDRKQSIYGFQGADSHGFDRERGALRQQVEDAGQHWADVELETSFRSTAPVLALVDAVFAGGAAMRGVVEHGHTLRHLADRSGHAGCVELWPLTPVAETRKPAPWSVPDDYTEQESAPQRLADRLAAWIGEQTAGGVILESKGRPLGPGDVLVLVRVRNAFARALVRALKARGVAVAGLDRLVLTEQPAVQDLLALCDTLLLPEDDLSLACVLTSPLGGLDDDDLMELAVGRPRTLWEALHRRAGERPGWAAAASFLSALLRRVDYLAPHALLTEALGPLGGRARLFARLGPEAAEPVDELLTAALAYAGSHPPSLQGFVQWVRQSGSEVTRQAEGAGGAVRIMTVHGAKGLQAPLVILPDTTGLPPDEGRLLWARDSETGIDVPIWSPRKALSCQATRSVREQARVRDMEEHHRLLYVALTRAEDRLVVCGWAPRRAAREPHWYELVRDGFAGLETEEVAFDDWGTMRRLASPQRDAPATFAMAALADAAPLPGWAGAAPHWRPSPPPAEPARPLPLAPSRPDGAALGPVPQTLSPLETAGRDRRFRRGELIHALLQHLPALPAPARAAAARAFLARPGHDLTPNAMDEIAAETLAIMDHKELAPLFGPAGRAEVPLTGLIGDAVVGGLVDRMAVLPERVLVADFKTNRDPPQEAARTPVLYLRQLAAYRAVLRGVFPDRPVRCALVWTRAARVVMLPDDLLDQHAPGASPALDPAAASHHLPANSIERGPG